MILALDAMSLIVVGLAPSRSSQGDRGRRSEQDDHEGRMLGKKLAEGHALRRSRTVSGGEMVGQRASVENDGAAGDGGRDAASRWPPSGCREQITADFKGQFRTADGLYCYSLAIACRLGSDASRLSKICGSE